MAVSREQIQTQRYLKDLDPRFLDVLLGCADEIYCEAGDCLFQLGGKAEAFYLLKQGVIALEIHSAQRGTITIQTLRSGDLVGWSWLFPPHKWHFDAHVLETAELIRFDARAFLAACEADHEMGYQMQQRFARIMLDRLQFTRLQLLDIYGTGPR
ncbi:MAG: cyclic nucleotide-binding domain-containing protein [Candidatus Sericytochromatia bacterium]|nr:cyclic nucleotide-binding domain-containing protein [Candidatus Sericytochromatia bacterium]